MRSGESKRDTGFRDGPRRLPDTSKQGIPRSSQVQVAYASPFAFLAVWTIPLVEHSSWGRLGDESLPAAHGGDDLTACWESYLPINFFDSRRAIRWIIASLTNVSLLEIVPS
jgi:hypothetical protein